MRSRRLLWGGAGVVAGVGAIGGAWILSLPAARAFTSPPPIGASETEALLAALRPPKRRRPVIAGIGINDATETTDFLMPYGILRRAEHRVMRGDGQARERRPRARFPMHDPEPRHAPHSPRSKALLPRRPSCRADSSRHCERQTLCQPHFPEGSGQLPGEPSGQGRESFRQPRGARGRPAWENARRGEPF